MRYLWTKLLISVWVSVLHFWWIGRMNVQNESACPNSMWNDCFPIDNTNLVDVLSCLGGRFHVRHIPVGRPHLAVGQWHFALVVQVTLVADEQQRYRLVALHAQYLLAANGIKFNITRSHWPAIREQSMSPTGTRWWPGSFPRRWWRTRTGIPRRCGSSCPGWPRSPPGRPCRGCRSGPLRRRARPGAWDEMEFGCIDIDNKMGIHNYFTNYQLNIQLQKRTFSCWRC